MAGEVTDTHRITYRENFRLALQEGRRPFDPAFTFVDGLGGKQVMVTDLIGKTEARIDAPEGGDTPNIAGNHEPIWMKPRRIDWGKVISKEDQIKALTDFKSPYIQAGVKGMNRAHNSIQATALFASRLIGNEVPVASAWAGREIAITVGGAGPSQGMNVKKIIAGFEALELDDVDIEEEEIFLGLDPTEMKNLYDDITWTSKDYRDKAVIEQKRVLSILGVTIIPTKRIADKAANQSTAALWCKSGMAWGPFMPLVVKSEPDVGKQYREHPYAEEWMGATRVEDAKVAKIINLY